MPEPAKRVAKILRSGEYAVDAHKYIIQTPKIFKRTKEQEIDESSKKIDELRSEISELEKQINEKNEKAEHDAEEIVLKAEQEAERIVDNAEKSAFERVKKSLDDKDNVILEKNTESDQIITDAQQESQKIISEAHVQANQVLEDAKKAGIEQGMDQGFEAAKIDVQHMVERLHSIVNATLEERERILIHSEQQVLNLVITMVEKVVKRLTAEEKEVVINNVREALQLIRGSMRVYIHVNPDDYHYTIRHKEEFIAMIEGTPEVKFFENPKVDRGGVYIETDTGEVDATIAGQLNDIIDKIKFYMPIQVASDLSKKKLNPLMPSKTLDQELTAAGTVDSKAVESAMSIPQYRKDQAKESIAQYGQEPQQKPVANPVPKPQPQSQPAQPKPAPEPVVQEQKPVPAPKVETPAPAPKAETPAQSSQPKPAPVPQVKKTPEQLEAERKRQIAQTALESVDNAPIRTGDVPDFVGEPEKPAPKKPEPKPEVKEEPKVVDAQPVPLTETIMGTEIVEAPLDDEFLNSVDEIEVPDIDISHLDAGSGEIPVEAPGG